MKKQLLIITILILLTLTIFSVTGNFYWYRTSTGTTAQVGAFPKESEPGMIFDFTIFATTEGGSESSPAIKIDGSSRVIGSVGTNALGSKAVALLSWPSPRNIIDGSLSIGHEGNISNVVYADGWKVKPEDVVTGGVGNLEALRVYPNVKFPDFPILPHREDFSTPWKSGLYYEISEDGEYDNIRTTSSRTLTIDLKGETRKIRVKNLSIKGDVVLKNIGENGKLILYVDGSFNIEGGRKINYPEGEKDHTRFTAFYSGTNNMDFGQSAIAGDLISKTANIMVGNGNVVIGNIISQSGDITINGAAKAFDGIVYTPNGDVLITNSGASGIIVGKTIECSGNVVVKENREAIKKFPYELF